MKILKLKGKDEQTVLQEIKREYGDEAIIISSTQEKKQGLWRFFQKPSCVITIALNEENSKKQTFKEITDPNQATTQKLLLQLQTQLEDLKKDLHHPPIETKELSNNPLYETIKQSLSDEGVDKEPLSFILKDTENITDLSEMAHTVYQRMLSIFEKLETVDEAENIFFIGSTGVGKTTTIAKLTATAVLKEQKEVALFTADTYRIAAIEQLKTYADILNVPIEIIYSESDLSKALEKWRKCDQIFIDTAGRSHKNVEQIGDIKKLLESVKDKKVYLVLNMNTSTRDILPIITVYKQMTEKFELIITKLDETDELGNLINIVYYTQAKVAYITDGQDVPDDFKVFDVKDYITALLGRIKYE